MTHFFFSRRVYYIMSDETRIVLFYHEHFKLDPWLRIHYDGVINYFASRNVILGISPGIIIFYKRKLCDDHCVTRNRTVTYITFNVNNILDTKIVFLRPLLG